MEKQSGWTKKTKNEIKQIFLFCEEYKNFLDKAKTERESVTVIEKYLCNNGFLKDSQYIRIYHINKGKTVAAFVRGEENLLKGLNIIAAHIDAPRLDLKQNPLYEDVDLALLRTHYYGGIKKYQWVTIPLAIHGIVIKKDGRKIELALGEDEKDPVFVIDDLLPHLSRKVLDEKKMADAIEGEKLTVLFGSMPVTGMEKESIKGAVLKLLNDSYGIIEEDFVSAELEIVPAFKARDIGIDRSMVGAYGQDDRACAYTLLKAICNIYNPHNSCLAIFTDKEEIGSEGNTGIKSAFLQMVLYDILENSGIKTDESSLRKMLFKSRALSADVNAGLNPTYQDVHEKQNACYLGHGICITKFTGHGGKSGANDANAEYTGEIRSLFNRENIIWQTGEMGKIDAGGGGTVAKHLAVYGMDTIDCGTPLLAMHSPFEISSKLDIYETFRAFTVFFKS